MLLHLLKQLVGALYPFLVWIGTTSPASASILSEAQDPTDGGRWAEHHLYFVVEGVQRVYYVDELGWEATLVFTYAPSFGGVVDALMQHRPDRSLLVYQVVAGFIDQQEERLSLLRDVQRKNLKAVRVPLSVAPWIRLLLGDLLAFVVVGAAHRSGKTVRVGGVTNP